jgi:hypothetical protein
MRERGGCRDGRSVDSCVGYFRGLRNRALRVGARAAVCEAVPRAISRRRHVDPAAPE